MTPSEFSEHKERYVVLFLHHRHVGVMNARSCAKQMHAAFFRGERNIFARDTFMLQRALERGGDLYLQCSLSMRSVHDMQSRATTRAFARSMTEISGFHRFTMCIGYRYLAVQHIDVSLSVSLSAQEDKLRHALGLYSCVDVYERSQ